jgi:ATP-dependent helicase/nuclease subunit A
MSAPKLIVDDRTNQQQALASDPNTSVWVSANAGSGKTTVLARRVVRLLLNGTDPSRILCITYTKAAAGEMANRVFEILGDWAVATDQELREKLTKVEQIAPTAEQLKRARTLFARALETPGGLKIQTIHAFCEALLHQFPLEANVPGTFSVADDRTQKELLEQARRSVLLKAYTEPNSELGKGFVDMLEFASDSAIEKALSEAITRREELTDWLDKVESPQAAEAQARKRFQFSSEETITRLTASYLDESAMNNEWWRQLESACSGLDQSGAKTLKTLSENWLASNDPLAKFDILEELVLTGKGEARSTGKYPSKPICDVLPNIKEEITVEATRILEFKPRINALNLIINSTGFFTFASAMIYRYREEKRIRGLLDFDDLVSRTVDLLQRSHASAWVLYKLDWGIDHLLLDEAQDTSPRQWQVVEALVNEFFGGASSRETDRTVFAVGDEKQSIYSFQGAEPASFARQKDLFKKRAYDSDKLFNEASLGLSFRSTEDVLGAVDKVFNNTQYENAVTAKGDYQRHTAARKNDPGHVDVWKMETSPTVEQPQAWHETVDQSDNQHQAVRTANRIADQIADWLDRGERFDASGKLVTAGDIIVLVRARDRFVTAINRALKDKRIPVAGSDRLTLTNHIAVQDLITLGQVIVTPQDDLSLAAVLKSPLFGMRENELFELSQSRFKPDYEASLFEALSETDGTSLHMHFQRLQGWMRRVDTMPVYEFFGQVLGADGGRKQFLARLGPEVEEVLDAFLAMALEHERSGLPGMQSFLEALLQEEPVIKREQDQVPNEVRVMTVHASKGLEAPIVFLVDKGSPAFQSGHAPAIYEWGEDNTSDPASNGLLWVSNIKQHSNETLRSLNHAKQQAEDEYLRLLYVGMTRAKDRLIVCGYQGKKGLQDPNWHTIVSNALEPEATVLHDESGEEIGMRWHSPNRPEHRPVHHKDEAPLEKVPPTSLPGWIGHKLPIEKALPRPLSPSGAQTLIDERLANESDIVSLLETTSAASDGLTPAKRGTLVHRLLQVLPDVPPPERREVAVSYLKRNAASASQSVHDALLKQTFDVLDNPDLSPWFDPAISRAEVPVMGKIELASGLRSVSGTIDRLVVSDERVVLLDYKTSAFVPQSLEQVSKDYITQMALYRHLVHLIYPDKFIDTVLIWTQASHGPMIMQLPTEVLDQAYCEIAAL